MRVHNIFLDRKIEPKRENSSKFVSMEKAINDLEIQLYQGLNFSEHKRNY